MTIALEIPVPSLLAPLLLSLQQHSGSNLFTSWLGEQMKEEKLRVPHVLQTDSFNDPKVSR
jgi:hypothetical protein